MIDLVTTPEAEIEQVPIFSIDGKVFTISAKPRANVGLKYLRDIRDADPIVAKANMMVAMMGEEAYNALCDFDGLTPDQLSAIENEITEKALGAVEKDAVSPGNS